MVSMSGLSRRVEALEAAHVDAVYRREAERLAQQYGGEASSYLDQLHAVVEEIFTRFGPQPDMREVARWVALEHGLDADELYAQAMAAKEEP